MPVSQLLSLLLFVVGLLTFPFYVMKSGVPQPAHMVFFLSALLAILFVQRHTLYFLRSAENTLLLSFVSYVFVVNLCIGLYFGVNLDRQNGSPEALTIGNPTQTLVYASYYIFNGCLFVGTICLALNFIKSGFSQTFWSVVLFTVLACLFLQASIGLLNLGRSYHTYRSILYFNNPNQLGYFSVACASILFVVQSYRPSGSSQVWAMVGFVLALYLAALSMSKAAFLALMTLPIVYLLSAGLLDVRRIGLAVIAFGVIVMGASLVDETVTENLSHRLSTIGQHSDDSLEGRAYDRIIKYPEYLLFGAGEGFRYRRFHEPHEIHSLPATLLFSYGIVGTLLFLAFLWQIYRRAGLRAMAYLVPLGLYNLTHNGFRSPLLWIMLALIVIGALTTREKQQDRSVSKPAGYIYR